MEHAIPGTRPGDTDLGRGLLLALFQLAHLCGLVGLLMWCALVLRGLGERRLQAWLPLVLFLALFPLAWLVKASGVPRSLAFERSRPALEALLSRAPLREWGGEAPPGPTGLYHVDEYAADPRGGVYFRVRMSYHMIDTVSYGLAYQPNREGSPFGNADYELQAFVDDWYWFTANDDW